MVRRRFRNRRDEVRNLCKVAKFEVAESKDHHPGSVRNVEVDIKLLLAGTAFLESSVVDDPLRPVIELFGLPDGNAVHCPESDIVVVVAGAGTSHSHPENGHLGEVVEHSTALRSGEVVDAVCGRDLENSSHLEKVKK